MSTYSPLTDEYPKSAYRKATSIVVQALPDMATRALDARANALAVLPTCREFELRRRNEKAWRWCRLRCDQERAQLLRVRAFIERYQNAVGDQGVGARTLLATVDDVLAHIAKVRAEAPALPSEAETWTDEVDDLAVVTLAAPHDAEPPSPVTIVELDLSDI